MKERVTEALTLWSNFNEFLCFASHLSVHNRLLHVSLMLLTLQQTAEFMCLYRSAIPDTWEVNHTAPCLSYCWAYCQFQPNDLFSAQPHVTVCLGLSLHLQRPSILNWWKSCCPVGVVWAHKIYKRSQINTEKKVYISLKMTIITFHTVSP